MSSAHWKSAVTADIPSEERLKASLTDRAALLGSEWMVERLTSVVFWQVVGRRSERSSMHTVTTHIPIPTLIP